MYLFKFLVPENILPNIAYYIYSTNNIEKKLKNQNFSYKHLSYNCNYCILY